MRGAGAQARRSDSRLLRARAEGRILKVAGRVNDQFEGRRLRSDAWFRGTTETPVQHRLALRQLGIVREPDDGRPVIGIAQSAGDVNPCNADLVPMAAAVKRGVWAAGGIPLEFPTITLGEDLMKPTAMLYRNLMAMDVE